MSKYILLHLLVHVVLVFAANAKVLVSKTPYPHLKNAQIVELHVQQNVASKPNETLPPDILRGFVVGPKTGPVYLLLGGITTNAGTFHETAKALADKGARVYAINPIYQGAGIIKSEPHKDRKENQLHYNLFKMTEHIYEILPKISAANQNKPINVVAHSLQGIVMRMALLGLSFDKHSNFVEHPDKQELIQRHLESLTLYFTPSFESLKELKANNINMVKIEAGLFLLVDAVPKYYKIRQHLLALSQMQQSQNYNQFEKVTSNMWNDIQTLTQAYRHGGLMTNFIHKTGAQFLRQVVFGLIDSTFNKQVSTTKDLSRFQSEITSFLQNHDLERSFLEAEEKLLVPTLKKLNRVPLFKLLGNFAQGFMNIDTMNSKQIIEFLRATMSEEVHVGIRDHLLKIAKTGQLTSIYTQESLAFDITQMYFKHMSEKPELLKKVVYYADYNDPLAPGKKIVKEAKTLSTPYLKNNCGHCGAANPNSAEVMASRLLQTRKQVITAQCLKLF